LNKPGWLAFGWSGRQGLFVGRFQMDMSRGINESDWKLFRQLRVIALDRFCQRVLGEIGNIASDAGKSSHERYLAIFRLLNERNREMADAFNDPRRSVALIQLRLIRSLGLLTEEEKAQFRQETRDFLQFP
jgi:hypothetical protein